jgi:hypothetical protein
VRTLPTGLAVLLAFASFASVTQGRDAPARAFVPAPSIAVVGGSVYADVWLFGDVEKRGARQPGDAVEVFLRGPGVASGARQMRCIGTTGALHCDGLQADDTGRMDVFYPRQGTGWALPATPTEGRYSIEAIFDGRSLFRQDFDLIKMPSIGGASVLVRDPTWTANEMWATPNGQFVVWLPVDRRHPERSITAVWLHDGQPATSDVAVLHGPPADGPLFDVRPLQLRSPGDPKLGAHPAKGRWQVVLVADAKRFMGSFAFAFDGNGTVSGVDTQFVPRSRNGWPFWGRVGRAEVPVAVAERAIKSARPDPSLKGEHDETVECAVAFEPEAPKILARLAELQKAWNAAQSNASVSYTSSYDTAEERAAKQNRGVTAAEREQAGRAGDRGSAGARSAIAKIEAEQRSEGARLRQLGKKYKPNCLIEAVPAQAKPFVEP